jgi:indole-3-glycerol phosphate synthase
MSDILQDIVIRKRTDVAAMQAETGLAAVREQAAARGPVLALAAALRGARPRGTGTDVRIIAEIKRRSPSKGTFPWHGNAVRQAVAYQKGGARAISVVTDGPFFGGSNDLLRQVQAHARVPVLQKEFVIDPYQIYLARALGADAVLLIARCLPGGMLAEFQALADEVGLGTLVEVVDREELQRAVDAGSQVIGVNNRDLRTFTTDLQHTLDLLPEIPEDRVAVTESGIHTRADVERMLAAGVDAFLIGEALMVAADPTAHLNMLRGQPVAAEAVS